MNQPIRIIQDHHICGEFGETFSARDIYRFGLYLAGRIKSLGAPQVIVATDGRPLNRMHVEPLIGGLQGGDCDVTSLGVAPYPMLAYAAKTVEIPHAVMMTSGEAEDGTIGFRVVLNHEPVASFVLKDAFEESRDAAFLDAGGNGRLRDVDLKPGYLRWLLHGARFENAIKVLWNPNAGATAEMVANLAGFLPGRHVVIAGGDAPHVATRDEEGVALALGGAVAEGGFDLGVDFDGDGGRAVMVDNLGRPLREEHRLFILSIRRERQPVAGNGLLATRRKAKSDAIKHVLKVIQAVAGLPFTAAELRDRASGTALTLGKGSVKPVRAGTEPHD